MQITKLGDVIMDKHKNTNSRGLSPSISTQLSAAIICREANEPIGPHSMAEVVASKMDTSSLPTNQEEVRRWISEHRNTLHPELAFPGSIAD